MKKTLAVLAISLAAFFGSPPPTFAAEYPMITAATVNTTGLYPYVETGEPICELKITGTSDFVGVITLYHGIKISNGAIDDAAVWFTVANPDPNDPNNHLIGACPKYVSVALTGYFSGNASVFLRTKK